MTSFFDLFAFSVAVLIPLVIALNFLVLSLAFRKYSMPVSLRA